MSGKPPVCERHGEMTYSPHGWACESCYWERERMSLGWHVIPGERLVDLLRRAAEGEDPYMLYIEEYVNADHERVEGEED